MKKHKQAVVDLNCDLGEGLHNDAAIMPYIHSCNIACGGHAGNADSMNKTVQLALQHQLNIGAHPSYPDAENFGRKPMDIALPLLKASLLEQITRLQTIAKAQGACVSHIKPHGALYNRAAVDQAIMQLLVDVVKELNEHPEANISLLGLSLAPTATIAEQAGIAYKHEAFVDRHYQNNGQLVPRHLPNAVIDTIDVIAPRAANMVQQQSVQSVNGQWVSLRCDTLCIHGDHPQAAAIAQAVYQSVIMI